MAETFEQAYARLEAIVQQLEAGTPSLDESLSLYEEGVKLLKTCHGTLENARRKIELFTGLDEQGNPTMDAWSDEERTLEERAETRGR